MFGWSINLFRIRGIQLAVHWSFMLLLAYAAYDGWQDGGWDQLLWSVALLLAVFFCLVLHEFGHSLTAIYFGVGVRRILVMPIGGMAEFDSIPRQPSRELLITLAGPAVNFAIAAVLWPIVGWPGDDYPATAAGFGQMLLVANLIMGCFNLLPVFPMDGGRILRALLATRLP
jgi:Zn-dependent protease